MVEPDAQSIQISMALCAAAYLGLLWVLRKDSVSLGLPFAYMSLLFLYHVPGAYVQLADDLFIPHRHEVALGIRLTAIGAVCFTLAVWAARAQTAKARLQPMRRTSQTWFQEDKPFWWFCVVGGWLFSFCLTPLRGLPTVGAIVYNGGAIWMLGVILGLRAAVRKHDTTWIMIWAGLLAAYPALVLITIGFLSYGTAAVVLVVSALAISGRSYWRIVITTTLTIYLALSAFSNYFQARDNLRSVIWSGASIEKRVDAISRVFTNFKFFDGTDQLVLVGFDLRLNQNYFIGVAQENIEGKRVEMLHGKSVSDALLALIPRVLWPEKTVYGGSPEIVAKMTGIWLNPDTSWGVGNVMEFYINFGIPGLVGGFLILGWFLGRLDHRAALAEAEGDRSTAVLFFLPAVALIQPLGSMVELTGGAGTACIAAIFWNWVWKRWKARGNTPMIPVPEEAPQ